MSTIMYGIPNCDTIKKAQKWLDDNGVQYQFHNYRADGLDQTLFETLRDLVDWSELINKRSTTYRQLTDTQKSSLENGSSDDAAQIIIEQPTLLKRPIIVKNSQSGQGKSAIVGFKADKLVAFFAL